MRTYQIIDEATGQVVAIQRWNDDVAPHVQPGQRSVPVADEDDQKPAAGEGYQGMFDKAGASAPYAFSGDLDVTISGDFNATVQLEVSTNDGVTWASVQDTEQGIPFAWSAPADIALADMPNGLYRLNCVLYQGGEVHYTMGGGQPQQKSPANAAADAGTLDGGPSPEAIPQDQRPTPGDAAQGGSGAQPAPNPEPLPVGSEDATADESSDQTRKE